MPTTIATFEPYTDRLRELVERHRELEDEPLHLALAFRPERDPTDVFLFEVVGNFGEGAINPDASFFEVAFDSSLGFALEPGRRLRLVLTSPTEAREAARHGWASHREIRDAVRRGDFRVLFSDDLGDAILGALR